MHLKGAWVCPRLQSARLYPVRRMSWWPSQWSHLPYVLLITQGEGVGWGASRSDLHQSWQGLPGFLEREDFPAQPAVGFWWWLSQDYQTAGRKGAPCQDPSVVKSAALLSPVLSFPTHQTPLPASGNDISTVSPGNGSNTGKRVWRPTLSPVPGCSRGGWLPACFLSLPLLPEWLLSILDSLPCDCLVQQESGRCRPRHQRRWETVLGSIHWTSGRVQWRIIWGAGSKCRFWALLLQNHHVVGLGSGPETCRVFLFFTCFCFFNWRIILYSVGLVPAAQWIRSAVCVHISSPPSTSLPNHPIPLI